MKYTFFAAIIVVAVTFTSTPYATGLLGSLPAQPQLDEGSVIARGMGGNLTRDSMNAYIEALEFCLTELGSPQTFSTQQRQDIEMRFSQGFAGLPLDTQQALVNARMTWTQYRNAWPGLSLDQKKAFAYDVLGLAYGEQAAAQALGLNQQSAYNPGSSGNGSSYSEPCYMCTEQGSITYGGGIDMGGGEFAY